MRGNEWKLVLAFVVGAVLSFWVGMYLLGPLFVSHRSSDATKIIDEANETNSATTLAESIPNGVYRRDIDSIPDATTVIVEPIPKPLVNEPKVGQPYRPFSEPSISPTQPKPQPRQTETSKEQEPNVSEPISPPTTIQPPQPPEKILPPPPSVETKRNYRVRLGVFSREENVKKLMEELVNQGYHPYTEEETLGGQKRYRIYVGAFDDRESAEKLKQELSEKGFPGIVEEKQE